MAGQASGGDEYDVVVLGTGAAGLTAAVRAAAGGARVGLVEKAETVGGTSAWSGGTVWLPNNRHEAQAGFTDSREDVLTYLMPADLRGAGRDERLPPRASRRQAGRPFGAMPFVPVRRTGGLGRVLDVDGAVVGAFTRPGTRWGRSWA